MKNLDQFEQIAFDAEICTVIMGNGTDFELVSTNGKPVTQETAREFQQKGFEFYGVIGLVGFVPRIALALPLDAMTIAALSKAFLGQIEGAITKLEKAITGDSAAFLQTLYNLPDNREEMN
jgi:hypothetical protein